MVLLWLRPQRWAGLTCERRGLLTSITLLCFVVGLPAETRTPVLPGACVGACSDATEMRLGTEGSLCVKERRRR